jgi:hypothetical protein
MTDTKFTELTELSTVADSDILAIVDDPAGTPVRSIFSKYRTFWW